MSSEKTAARALLLIRHTVCVELLAAEHVMFFKTKQGYSFYFQNKKDHPTQTFTNKIFVCISSGTFQIHGKRTRIYNRRGCNKYTITQIVLFNLIIRNLFT